VAVKAKTGTGKLEIIPKKKRTRDKGTVSTANPVARAKCHVGQGK
jgi:hypothetical protein